MTGLDHPLVRAYLERLDALTAGTAPEHRAELRADIEEHLREALGAGPTDDARVAVALDRLGPPEDLAAEAVGSAGGPGAVLAPPAPRAPTTHRVETAALVLLALSVVLTVTVLLAPLGLLAWLVGLVLLFVSTRWTPVDKVVGAVAYGVVGTPLVWVALLSPIATFNELCVSGQRADGTTYEQCSGGPPSWWGWLVGAVALAVVVLWVWAGRRLVRAARRPAPAVE